MNKVCEEEPQDSGFPHAGITRMGGAARRSVLPALMFALKPLPFSIINAVAIQEFVDSMQSDEYHIPVPSMAQ